MLESARRTRHGSNSRSQESYHADFAGRPGELRELQKTHYVEMSKGSTPAAYRAVFRRLPPASRRREDPLPARNAVSSRDVRRTWGCTQERTFMASNVDDERWESKSSTDEISDELSACMFLSHMFLQASRARSLFLLSSSPNADPGSAAVFVVRAAHNFSRHRAKDNWIHGIATHLPGDQQRSSDLPQLPVPGEREHTAQRDCVAISRAARSPSHLRQERSHGSA